MTITVRFFSMLADILLRLRHNRGESQEAVAERAGFSGTQVSRWERGQTMPDVDSLLRMLAAYEHRLVIMPWRQADTIDERDLVVAAARRWHENNFAGEDELGRALDALAERERRADA